MRSTQGGGEVARTYYRDRYGRFASKGSKLYAVRKGVKKLIAKSAGAGTRTPHRHLAGIKMWASVDHRKALGKAPRDPHFKRALKTIGTGRRRRGMSIQQISRVHKTTRTARAFPPMGALARSGYGTGRRRTVVNVGKAPTARVRRSTPKRIAMPRRRRGR
jgi:hypothetical protein